MKVLNDLYFADIEYTTILYDDDQYGVDIKDNTGNLIHGKIGFSTEITAVAYAEKYCLENLT